jgi:hypothetical protein
MMIYRYVVVRVTNQYGNLRCFPVGPMANAFARIAGQKTLSINTLREIIDLGLPVMADGSSTDIRSLEGHLNCQHPPRNRLLIEHRALAEEELEPMMEAHLDNKAEHGT